jgi:uncharacterized membrane protein YjjP (DUF1212 family)
MLYADSLALQTGLQKESDMSDPLQPDLDRAQRRAAHYWLRDGLNEVTVGVLLVLVGVYLAVESAVPRTQPLRTWIAFGLLVLVAGLGLGSRRMVLALKDHYVHPRTGYVALRQPNPRSRWLAGLLGGVIAALFAIVAKAPAVVAWIPAVQGLVLGLLFFATWSKVELTRFPVEGLLCALAGLGLSLLGIDESLASGLVFGWAGLVMAVGGALAFRSYRRTAPVRVDP